MLLWSSDISGSSSDYSDVSSSSGTGTGTGMLAFPSSVPESSTEASTLPYDARPAYTAPPGCPSPDLPVAGVLQVVWCVCASVIVNSSQSLFRLSLKVCYSVHPSAVCPSLYLCLCLCLCLCWLYIGNVY